MKGYYYDCNTGAHCSYDTNESLAEKLGHAYEQGKEDEIDERASLLAFICKKYKIPLMDMNETVDEWSKKNGRNEM